MGENEIPKDFKIDSPELREMNKNIIASRVQNYFPNTDLEVIKQILEPAFNKDVLLKIDDPVETVPKIISMGLIIMLEKIGGK